MFDLACIVLATALAYTAVNEQKGAALVIAFEFLLHTLAYDYILIEERAHKGWIIYLMYIVIQVTAMVFLFRLKAKIGIITLVFINLCYNILTVLGYFYIEFIPFYCAYQAVVGVVMALELVNLGMLNRYVKQRNNGGRKRDSNSFTSVFYVRSRNTNRSLL